MLPMLHYTRFMFQRSDLFTTGRPPPIPAQPTVCIDLAVVEETRLGLELTVVTAE